MKMLLEEIVVDAGSRRIDIALVAPVLRPGATRSHWRGSGRRSVLSTSCATRPPLAASVLAEVATEFQARYVAF